MGKEQVLAYLSAFGRQDILEFSQSTATVQLAAEALGTTPPRIAKSIALKGLDEEYVLVVAAGDARVDNRKFRDAVGLKPKMLSPEETKIATGYDIGGVCPFGVPETTQILLDESLKRFDTVYPACGTPNTAIKVTIDQLAHYIGSPKWVDVCKDWDPELT